MSTPVLRLFKPSVLFLIAVVVLSLGLSTVSAQDAPTNINLYSDADTNITDWYEDVVIPAFQEAYPQYVVTLTIVRGGVGQEGIAMRALAALETNSDPQVDFFDGFDPLNFPPETIEADLWLELNEENIPNLANVNPDLITSDYGAPYRGSQVLLAYNSNEVPAEEVPTTFEELAAWVQAHPGEFVYCRPDRGGSGGNFVVRAIFEANGQDASLFTPTNYTPELAEQLLTPAWDILREQFHPYIYENGSYPADNVSVLQLLANDSVNMATVWSDQSLQALSLGSLPDYIKLTQFTDMPMPGGYVYNAIPKNAANLEGALALADFMLTPEIQTSVIRDIGGFPVLPLEDLPAEVQSEFQGVITEDVPPIWPGGDWTAARNQGWYENVATNIDPES